MGYKKELKHRLADLFGSKPFHLKLSDDTKSKNTKYLHRFGGETYTSTRHMYIPSMLIVDSSRKQYFGVVLPEPFVPYLHRKAGEYGMIYEEGTCINFGVDDVGTKSRMIELHIVTIDDLQQQSAEDIIKSLKNI